MLSLQTGGAEQRILKVHLVGCIVLLTDSTEVHGLANVAVLCRGCLGGLE